MDLTNNSAPPFRVSSTRYCRAIIVVTAYGIGKYLVNRLNIKGIERMEKTKLARIN
jgi:hypothetical protein